MNKITSILLALALVLSMGLLTGTPVQAAVGQAEVTVDPVLAGAVAEYTVVFDVTASLTAGTHSITIDFPSDTGVPTSYGTGNITVNGNAVASGDVSVAGRAVTLITPVTIVAPATVTVGFIPSANITNPTTTGDYKLKVNTSRETTPVDSAAYAIRELPTITGVSPGQGNVGGTMWVVIAGTSFMGNSDTNASETTINFGAGADVLQTRFISVSEVNVKIEVKNEGSFSVKAQTPAGDSTANGSFTANAAGTKQVDVWQKYTPSDTIFTVDTLVFTATYSTIGTAIGGAGTDYTLLAHDALYEEDLVINKQGLTLTSISGKDDTTIKGVTLSQWGVSTNPNIDVRADGVKLHGFTIQGPEPSGTLFAAGMLIGAQDVEIYDNAFEVNNAGDTVAFDDVSQGIVTYHKDAVPGVDVSGLNVHDNSFTHRGAGSVGYEGIYINRDTGTGTVTIADNEFTGKVLRAITTERSNTDISGNSIITDLAPGLPGGYMGILVRDYAGAAQDAVTLVDNTVKGSGVGKGFAHGIRIGGGGQTLTNINISRNTVQDNDTGILVSSSAGGVTVNYNNIDGNSDWGLENADSAKLDALYNWWGHAIGPHHDTRNPGGQINAVSGNADFSPWLYKPEEQFAPDAPCLAGSVVLDNEATSVTVGGVTSYVGGWNSFSTPIVLDSSGNSVSELLALAGASDLFILRAQRFNPDTQQWVTLILNNTLITDYQIGPGEGFFIQVRDKGSLPVLVATGTTAPPMRDLAVGWNLVGTSSLSKMSVATALSGVDYSVVLSPKPPNDVAWSVPPSSATTSDLQLGEAYWVAMSGTGVIFGYTYTPVPSDMTWELNQ
ncbi:MAG: hypothetical protein ACLFVD_02445 [Dehalococcoidia bacterium]